MKLTILLGGILFAWIFLSGPGAAAQTAANMNGGPLTGPNVATIKAWYVAFEKKDWNSMQGILADGFTFSSPLDDRIDVTTFKERCWPNAYKIQRIDVDKFIINGDSAVVITNGWTTEGKLFRNSDYFRLKDGKIMAYECFFGPGVNYPNSGK